MFSLVLKKNPGFVDLRNVRMQLYKRSVDKIQLLVGTVEKMGRILCWTPIKVKHGNGLVM